MTTSEKRIYHMAIVAEVRDIISNHKDACSRIFLYNFDNSTTLTTPYTKGFRRMTKKLISETLEAFSHAIYRLAKNGHKEEAEKITDIQVRYNKFFGRI